MISEQERAIEAFCVTVIEGTVIEGKVAVVCLGRKWWVIYFVSEAHSGGQRKTSAMPITLQQSSGLIEKGLWAATEQGKGMLNFVA